MVGAPYLGACVGGKVTVPRGCSVVVCGLFVTAGLSVVHLITWTRKIPKTQGWGMGRCWCRMLSSRRLAG